MRDVLSLFSGQAFTGLAFIPVRIAFEFRVASSWPCQKTSCVALAVSWPAGESLDVSLEVSRSQMWAYLRLWTVSEH